jgi:CHAT domain-containing protein
MPSGHLYLLPFQILSRTGDMHDALVHAYTVFSISDLDVFLEDADREDLKLVAFGNADSSLPNAEVEVRDIAGLFEESQVYVREDATEARAKEAPPTFNVLHLATHGTLDFSDFENSFLTLAAPPGQGEDGRLTLGEIWGLSTLQNYRIVTLSACRSAVSDNFEDGWPVSPATAFFDVGVATVVASLWEVDDSATATLMREFYTRLPQAGAAGALRGAQLALMDTTEYADPFYWAPFVVTGDWR